MKDVFTYPLKRSLEYNNILECINSDKSPLLLNGLVSSQKAHMSYSLFNELKKQMIIISHSELEAKNIYEDLCFYAKDRVLYLSFDEIYFYYLDAKDRKEELKRLNVLRRLLEKDDVILVTSIEACLKKYIPSRYLSENIHSFKVGSVLNIDSLSESLSHLGYERVMKVEGMGQFSVRGGIIDIFTSGYDNPVRVELFDDEIDSIRLFDPISQKSIEKLEEFEIIPAKEIIYPSDVTDIVKKLKSELKKDINEDVHSNIEKISEKIYFEGLENYIDYLYEDKNKSIFSYLNSDAIIVFNEISRINEKIKNYFDEFRENYKINLERGLILKSQSNLIYRFEEVYDFFENRFVIINALFPKAIKDFKFKSIINFNCREMTSFNGKLNLVAEEISYLKKNKFKILLAIGSVDRANKLSQDLEKEGVTAFLINDLSSEIKASQVAIVHANLSEGFLYADMKFALITDKEIFGVHKKTSGKRKKFAKGKKIESFIDLNVGDYVVHEGHGIGRYSGIEQLRLDKIKKDYIKLVYSAGDYLYVPIDQMDKVQKYIGKDGEGVKLSKLGSSDWSKAKSKAKKNIEDMTKELIALYAKREETKGYKYGADTIWQREFEDLFPYDETEDQLKAIVETKQDMENSKVMDRLVCGDVGYGKTEVAIRAIFKACMESKQVAVLVPTTILAQQHYNTFKERFSNYPMRVEVLSRFKTAKEQRAIIDDLKRGLVDVVIGTHKIISSDIVFKDLGLLVVDEEQRFGVKHKEKLKKFKTSVDVLTLSATPIPRTLHMSLSGIREMSIIEEPPQERHPVITYVVEGKESIIADAVEREISRGGQVFFVYNRVTGIENIAALIRRVVPRAKIAVGHGQMSARELENVMIGFLKKEFDVLVCTTIIETGMDIQNANTIIIYDSDKMGLSQLYQLRGRVGRSSRQGYSYFMYEKDKVLSEAAEKRLKAIKEFTEFGSGFKIAMRDLEIRGAGNLLGSQQHGHMDVIGYDLYVKLLGESIRKIKGEPIVEEVDTEIELSVNAYIPTEYIADEKTKIEIYKKIASIESKEDKEEIEDELVDRFSDIPIVLKTLIMIAYIKSLGKKLKVKTIKQLNGHIYFEPHYKQRTDEKNHYKLVTEIANVLEKML